MPESRHDRKMRGFLDVLLYSVLVRGLLDALVRGLLCVLGMDFASVLLLQ